MSTPVLSPSDALAHILSNALDTRAWSALMRARVAEGDAEAGRCLRTIIAGLETLAAPKSPSMLATGTLRSGNVKLTEHQTAVFTRLAQNWNDPSALVEAGLVHLYDLRLPFVAIKHFELARELGSTDPALADHLEAAHTAQRRRSQGQDLRHSSAPSGSHTRPPVAALLRRTGKLDVKTQPTPPTLPELDAVLSEDPSALLGQAAAQCEAGEIDAAMRSAHLAMAGEPDAEEAFTTWATIGQTCFALHDMTNCILAYEQATRLRPDQMDAWFNLGTAFYLTGFFEKAQYCLEQAVQIEPDQPKINCNLGALYFQIDQIDASEAALRRSLAAQPEYARAWHNLGTLLGAQARYDEAVEALQRALALRNGVCPESSLKLGMIYYDREQFPQAEEAFRRAERLEPWVPYAKHFLAMIYARTGRVSEAWQAYEEGFSMDRNNELGGQALNEIGLAHLTAGDAVNAIAAFQQAIDLNGEDFTVVANLGLALLRRHKLADAKRYLSRAVELEPESGVSWHTLGLVCAALGQTREADEAFNYFIKSHPNNPKGYYDLGVSLDHQHRFEESKTMLRKAMQLSQAMPQVTSEFREQWEALQAQRLVAA